MSSSQVDQVKNQGFLAWGWKQSLGVLDGVQIAGGLLGFLVTAAWNEPATTTPYPLWIYFLHLVVFGAAAALLIIGSRRDKRAIYLGFTYLLAASAFSYRPLVKLSELFPDSAAAPITFLASLPLTAFLPYFLWRFFQEFPRGVPDGTTSRIHRTLSSLSLGTGVILFLIGTAEATVVFFGGSGSHRLLSLFSSRGEENVYWILLYGMLLPALVFAGLQARAALPRERRRISGHTRHSRGAPRVDPAGSPLLSRRAFQEPEETSSQRAGHESRARTAQKPRFKLKFKGVEQCRHEDQKRPS